MAELEALTVSAPATSANLGPGFDCLAVALDLGNAVIITRRPGPLEVRVTGEGAGELAEDASNLVCRALASGLGPLDGLAVECRNRIPLGARPGLVVGRRLRRPRGRQRPRGPALDARRAARPRDRAGGPRRQRRRLHRRRHRRGAARPGVRRRPCAGGAGLRRRHPRGAHLHRGRPPRPPRAGAARRRRRHPRQRRLAHAGPRRRVASTICPSCWRTASTSPTGPRRCRRSRPCAAWPAAPAAWGPRSPGRGPAVLLWCRHDDADALAAEAERALAAAGAPGRARPSRVSAAGVRARWTGGADLRLARAVG